MVSPSRTETTGPENSAASSGVQSRIHPMRSQALVQPVNLLFTDTRHLGHPE